MNSIIPFFAFLVLIVSCDSGPKVIEAEQSDQNETSTGIFSNSGGEESGSSMQSTAPPVREDIHRAVVKEVLPTEKYVYLNVREGEESYWIATVKQDVKVGETYYFKEGLLKTNFESREYDRVFDKLYLVSNIVPANHGNQNGMSEPSGMNNTPPGASGADKVAVQDPVQVEGSLPIADLVENPEAYEGKEVQISGRCTKVNPNIMGRHWIHLKDGTKDDYDLVLTSQTAIPEGAIVTMKGTVALDKDFGAGYRYDIIIEEADLVRK